jgi:hypothetical protein
MHVLDIINLLLKQLPSHHFAAQCLPCNLDNETNFGTSFLAVPTLYYCNMIGGIRPAKMHIQKRYYKYVQRLTAWITIVSRKLIRRVPNYRKVLLPHFHIS